MDASRLSSIPLFAKLGRHDRQRVAQWADEVEVKAGAQVSHRETSPTSSSMIEEGTASVAHDGRTVTDGPKGISSGRSASSSMCDAPRRSPPPAHCDWW